VLHFKWVDMFHGNITFMVVHTTEWQHPYLMNAITINTSVVLHTERQKVTNEHATGEVVSEF